MSTGYGHRPEDDRPQTCRNRLRDEGKAYPRSGCDYCKEGGLRGCIYDRRPFPPYGESGVKSSQADRMANLEAENERLREALRNIASRAHASLV